MLQVNNTATGTGWYDGGVYHELEFIRPIGYTYSVNHRSGSSTPWYSGDNQVLHSSTTVIFCQNVTNPFVDYRNFFENDEVFELKRRSQDDRWHVLRVNSSSDTVAGSRRLVTYNVTEIHRASGGHGAPSNTPYELRTNRATVRESLEEGDMVAHLGNDGPEILSAGTDGQILSMASGVPAWITNAATVSIEKYRLQPSGYWIPTDYNPPANVGSSQGFPANTYYQMFTFDSNPEVGYSFLLRRLFDATVANVKLAIYTFSGNTWTVQSQTTLNASSLGTSESSDPFSGLTTGIPLYQPPGIIQGMGMLAIQAQSNVLIASDAQSNSKINQGTLSFTHNPDRSYTTGFATTFQMSDLNAEPRRLFVVKR